MTDDTSRSPRILELSWGHMRIEGLGGGKDFNARRGETKAAAELYNRLAQTERVGGLFHSTC